MKIKLIAPIVGIALFVGIIAYMFPLTNIPEKMIPRSLAQSQIKLQNRLWKRLGSYQ